MKQSFKKKLITGISASCFYLTIGSVSIAASTSVEGIQIYQKNMHLSAERKQNLAADIDRYNNADNIWDTLRQEFTLPLYETTPRVQEQIDWFMNNQDFLYRSASRAAPYLYYILQQVRKRHLPAEVALLPILESSFNPFASSPVGAAGIWQMMPGTASGYGITQNWWYDGRRDVVVSTKAALNYLAYLSNFFDGNWLYAIAAYDTGEGNVLAAIKKNVRSGDSTDFWSLPVAQETRDYIPKLLALAAIVSNPEKYPVQLPYVRNAPYLAQIDIGAQIDLKNAADLAGLSVKEFKQLNPGYMHAATDPNGPYQIILPIENVEQFTENLEHAPGYHSKNWAHYKLKSGDNYNSLAKKFNTTPHELRQINPELAEKKLKRGVSMLIPHISSTSTKPMIEEIPPTEFASSDDTVADVVEDDDTQKVKNGLQQIVANNDETASPSHYSLQPGDTLYMVRNGDDIEKIATHFHTTARNLDAANKLSYHAVLQPGQQLIIPTHSTMTADNEESTNQQINPGDTIYMVRKHDTIEKIAARYHLSPSQLRIANLLQSNSVKEGDQIVIPSRV